MATNTLRFIIHHPLINMTRVYRDVQKLMSIKIMNTVKGHYSTEVISVPYFHSYFFDLTKQKMDIKLEGHHETDI